MNSQALKKPNLRQICEPLDMASGGPQFPASSISEDDITKIAIAVKQMLVHEFNNIIDEKQKPIIDEIAKLKQNFSNQVRIQGGPQGWGGAPPKIGKNMIFLA